ncbi:glycoside hydrolase family 113 [Aequorivita capsosiphonis]|uniref:glycoside hydrolase family 113 n=1 Tax=Aequorivita capsosiphonis TaxID=487317 RepID=UPI0003F7AD29|nr:glycoside hydrolase TIM-barrel-like domain-containing protein [Aequorivita capsosiphonis]
MKDEETLVSNKNISKINGVSFVASRDSLKQKNIESILRIHANYAAIMPFGFIKSLDHPEVVYNQDRQWYGETKKGAKQYVNLLHNNNIKVMMKPQIWVWRGEFTGLLKMASEADWLQLEASYKSFIIDYAKLAETEGIEIFCIGTELETFIEHRPEYWRELISEVKTVYKGKLTYAANWDEYKRVSFWDLLDYIGVDAYFPVSESKTPSLGEAKEGWERWKNELKAFSEKENKKILFTEYGYRSVNFSGKKPWKSDREMNSVNLEAQANLLKGLYQSVWEEDWFAGGFLWKWFIAHESVGGSEDNQFSPQNKPAEVIVDNCYSEN